MSTFTLLYLTGQEKTIVSDYYKILPFDHAWNKNRKSTEVIFYNGAEATLPTFANTVAIVEWERMVSVVKS